jgi:hypothetical protein
MAQWGWDPLAPEVLLEADAARVEKEEWANIVCASAQTTGTESAPTALRWDFQSVPVTSACVPERHLVSKDNPFAR